MVIAAVLAGGTGSRMGNVHSPKQFLPLGSRPILVHTVEKFVMHPEVDHVLVLTPRAWMRHSEDVLEQHLPPGRTALVLEGGATRNLTLRCALDYVEATWNCDTDTVLVTHDAVRPFVTHRIISDNIAAARQTGACDTVVPATDTIVQSCDGRFLTDIPARDTMYQGQTPQSFLCAKLRRLMRQLRPEEEAALTDACKIFAFRNEPVALVQGETHNLKITYPYDLKIAQALLGAEPEGAL